MSTSDGSDKPSESKLTHEGQLKRSFEKVATTHAADEFRDWFRRLYPRWAEFNNTFFKGTLLPPYMGVGQTPPRQFVACRRMTDYGCPTHLVFREAVMFGSDTRIVRAPYPAEGLLRFADDLLLHGTVKQYVMEVRGTTEDTWNGYGPEFTGVANRIGSALGIPEVQPRRRRGRDVAGVAASWPWALRPDGYYLGHVRFDHLKIGGLRAHPVPTPAAPGVYEYLLFLAETGRTSRLIDTLGQAVDRAKEVRLPALAADERRPADHTGRPLPMPSVDPAWLTWNGGCVRAMAEGIRHRRTFDVMPILADALQDAGCEDPVLLGHLRAHTEHTAKCWALHLLCGESVT